MRIVSVHQHNKHSSFNLARSVSSSSTLQRQTFPHFLSPCSKINIKIYFQPEKKYLNLKVEGHLISRKLILPNWQSVLFSILFINISIEKQLKNQSRQRCVSFSPWIIQTLRERVQIRPIE
jgi:hypothetical protein